LRRGKKRENGEDTILGPRILGIEIPFKDMGFGSDFRRHSFGRQQFALDVILLYNISLDPLWNQRDK
jgi:hypothetical protein